MRHGFEAARSDVMMISTISLGGGVSVVRAEAERDVCEARSRARCCSARRTYSANSSSSDGASLSSRGSSSTRPWREAGCGDGAVVISGSESESSVTISVAVGICSDEDAVLGAAAAAAAAARERVLRDEGELSSEFVSCLGPRREEDADVVSRERFDGGGVITRLLL